MNKSLLFSAMAAIATHQANEARNPTMTEHNQQSGSADLSAATSETFALYKAVNEMMAHLGAHGEIDARSDQAEAVMAALHNLDGGKVAQRVEDLVEKAFMPRDQATRLAVSEYCAVNEPSDAIAASRRAAGGDVLAWAHEDGRVIPASTKAAAERDGGAMASSLAGYTIPLGPIPASLPDVAMPFDRKEFMRLVLQSACEIPDRDSPENQPEMLLLTTKELENIMTSAFENVDEDAELVAQPAEGSAGQAGQVAMGGLTTLLQAAGAMRMVRCHDGSGEPFAAYDKEIADRVVADLRAEMHALEDAVESAASPAEGSAQVATRDYKPGQWFDARTLDEMQAFYLSRLPAIREAAKEHGYAIGLHGSERRDFDLMAMQWREDASDKDTLAHAIAAAACGISRAGPYQWEEKPNGRFAVSMPICWTDHANPDFDKPSVGHIDLSVIEYPAAESATPAPKLAHGHRNDYFLLANARRIGEMPIHRIVRLPNWALASELFATGSNSAHQICHDAGIDPDGLTVARIDGDKQGVQRDGK